MKLHRTTFLSLIVLFCMPFQPKGQNTSLQQCFELARQNNLQIRQTHHGIQAKQYALQAEKRARLPKIDVFAGYTYLSNPLTINLQTVKDGVVLGSSQQSVYTANEVYRQLTGESLPIEVQQDIYNTSYNIIETAYPDYNPVLSQQQYFTAGLMVRQPIWLGGKLNSARNVASVELTAGVIGQQVVENEVDFSISLQYLRILYLNRLVNLNAESVTAFTKNDHFVSELVSNQIIPPYYQSWTRVLLVQARSKHNNVLLDRENAFTEMKRLLGVSADTLIRIDDLLEFHPISLDNPQNSPVAQNPVMRLAGNNTLLAKTNIKGATSLLLPNLFGVANINLYQENLPVTTPPWMVGIELQWNLFDGFANYKRVQATRQIAAEVSLQEEHTRAGITTQITVALNRVKNLRNDLATLDSARSEAKTTTLRITERAKNNFSSPKEINDALIIQEEIEKSYYTAVLLYYTALAEYFNLTGAPRRITESLN